MPGTSSTELCIHCLMSVRDPCEAASGMHARMPCRRLQQLRLQMLISAWNTNLADRVAHKEYAGTKPIDGVAQVDVCLKLEGRK